MIDIAKVTYRVILFPETGKGLNITGITEDLCWEENKRELAARITMTVKNEKYNGRKISSYAKLNCYIAVLAKTGGSWKEAVRGRIVTWETAVSGAKDSVKLTCYDDLYDLQKSQDNLYYSSGTSTKNAIKKIFKEWNIPLEKYDGPDETHAKLVFKRKALSDIIMEILDDAEKKGSKNYIVHSSKGKISVLPKGSNKPVYHFGSENSTTVQNKWSTADMVTRVKVIGQEDDDGKSSVETYVDGKLKYGLRQKIVVRGKDDSLSDARDSAKEILDDKGDVEKTITVQSPDVPFIRKGDLVHVKSGSLNGYFFVEGIRHNADKTTMSMDLEVAKEETTAAAASSGGEFSKGDSVILNGAVYVDSYGNGKGRTFSNYKGKITIKVSTSRKCPYHIDHIGWVYPATIKKA